MRVSLVLTAGIALLDCGYRRMRFFGPVLTKGALIDQASGGTSWVRGATVSIFTGLTFHER
jgi:hypothetical protein